ncbi:MAG: YdcF family protein, partial [Alphaproteobacteria bacterium]
CKQSTKCSVDAMTMSEADVAAVADILAGMAKPGGPLSGVARTQMRPSGLFQRHAVLDDAAFMRAAWIETAAGINRLYRIYGLGERPRYGVDAISYMPEDAAYRTMVLTVIEAASDEAPNYTLFYQPWSRVGLDLLLINQRDEMVRYEPLAQGENRLAYARAANLDWTKFVYTAIVVPGEGTNDSEKGLSAIGALRVRMAVRRFQQGLAPFLVVSGGHVHPTKTPYAEAIEMKKELMRKYQVPASAILIDPYARHTTTNLRNATRLLYRAGAPMSRPVLVTTSQGQSASIEADAFRRRNEDELGYQPMTLVRRLNPNDLVMTPNIVSLHADPRDPLDP